MDNKHCTRAEKKKKWTNGWTSTVDEEHRNDEKEQEKKMLRIIMCNFYSCFTIHSFTFVRDYCWFNSFLRFFLSLVFNSSLLNSVNEQFYLQTQNWNLCHRCGLFVLLPHSFIQKRFLFFRSFCFSAFIILPLFDVVISSGRRKELTTSFSDDRCHYQCEMKIFSRKHKLFSFFFLRNFSSSKWSQIKMPNKKR